MKRSRTHKPSTVVMEPRLYCHCGKVGWKHQHEAERELHLMMGRPRVRRDPGVDQLNVYRCEQTGTRLWHVGHGVRLPAGGAR